MHRIEAAGIAASVAADGAELTSLSDAAGAELLWQAGPEWPRHAPVLFPIVGRLAGDVLRHDGQDHRLTQHGFARDRRFEWVERTADRAVLALADDDASRAVYPFPFRLVLTYRVEGASLSVTTRIENPGAGVLPCGVGAHPAFRWPLADGVAKTDHVLRFEAEERGPALPVVGGLLGTPRPLPFDGRNLELDEALFAEDAIVLPNVASRALSYEALGPDGAPVRRLGFFFEGYKDLGIWSKPSGAPFLCIEPWYGMASPLGWDGEFADKPGILLLQPGEAQELTWRVEV